MDRDATRDEAVPELELELDRGPRVPAPRPDTAAAPSADATPSSGAAGWDDEGGDGPVLELDDTRERRGRGPSPEPASGVPADRAPSVTGAPGAPPVAPTEELAGTTVDAIPRAPSVADPAIALAGYPPSPRHLHETPGYAVRVFLRQRTLRRALEQRREAQMPVAVYQRALRIHDARALTTGVVLMAIALLVAATIFCLPVIVRFARLAAMD